ncbi:MAG: carboxypeptidase-like regulatory domain-containing protein [Bacteroidales bacterium]|nr:carboxypeptidase-like regulatory domain-containing protein [Bacteroidales bacterium]
MCRKVIVFLCVLLCLYNTSIAQDIEGIVINSKTKTPLPFVNIIYNDQGHGTTTNIDGVFNINGNNIKKLHISYLGYYNDTILVDESKITIELQPKTYNLEEVIILPGENPANRIIQKVIENRDLNNPEKMQSFSFQSYNKMIFTEELETKPEIDSSINSDYLFKDQHVLVMETVNEKKFIRPDKYNETILASKVSGFSDPIFSLIASQVQALSFYNEFFTIMDKAYINPISKGSINRYFFMLEDTLFNERGDSIFVISYRPKKGKNFIGLKGFLHINTNRYAVQSVLAEPLEKDQGMGIKIKQNYEWIENTQWFPKELITEITFDKNNLIAKGKSYISNIDLNPDLNEKEFGNVELKMADDIQNKTDQYWDINRTQALTEMDKRTYHIIDSISEVYNLDRKLRNLEIIINGNIPVKCFDLPLNKIMDYNDYEGYRLGLGIMTNDKISKLFSIGGYFGYGFKDEEWKYGGDLILNVHKKSESKIHFSYSKDVKERSGYKFNEKPDFTTTEIYRKYMIENMDWVEMYEASYSFQSLQYLSSNIFFNQSVVSPTNNYDFTQNPTNLVNEFTFNEIGLKFRYAYNEKFMQTLRSKYTLGTNYPIFFGNIVKGVNWIDGEYEYAKYEAKITKSFRSKSLGKTKITLVGGLVKGNVPISKLYNGHGSYQSFSIESENSFGTMRMGEFYSDRFFSIFVKHDFGNILIRSEKFSPKFSLVHNYGIGSLSSKSNHITDIPLQSIEKGFYEGGILINNILNQSFLGYGFGIFYRYGPYSFNKTANNFSYKLSLTIGL